MQVHVLYASSSFLNNIDHALFLRTKEFVRGIYQALNILKYEVIFILVYSYFTCLAVGGRTNFNLILSLFFTLK